MKRARAKGRRPTHMEGLTVAEWAQVFPERPVTRKELYSVLRSILGPTKSEEAEQQPEVQA